LNGIFGVLGPAGIEVLLVEDIENAGGDIQVLSDRVPEQREVEDLIAGDGLLRQRQTSPQELPLNPRKPRLVDQWDRQIQLRHMTG